MEIKKIDSETLEQTTKSTIKKSHLEQMKELHLGDIANINKAIDEINTQLELLK